MALKIRLRQQGRKNRLSYRIVVADARMPRDGKYVDKVGLYDPYCKEGKDILIDSAKVESWLRKGAQLTEKAKALIIRGAPEVYTKIFTGKLDKKASDKKSKKSKKAEVKKAVAKKPAAKKAPAAKKTTEKKKEA